MISLLESINAKLDNGANQGMFLNTEMLGNYFPSPVPATQELRREMTVATPSKMELAIKHLKANPEHVKMPGRELEKMVQPMGVKISYRYWNDAKKEL